jgi:hypothetical protein
MRNGSIRSGLHTSLWLVVKACEHLPGPPRLPVPELITPEADALLVHSGINPNKSRKGKSGEISR